MKSKLPITILTLALLLGMTGPVRAADTTTFAVDTDYSLNGETMTVKAGSAYASLSLTDDSLTVEIPDGEAFEVTTPGIYPASIENDGGVAACNVITTRDNQALVYGPRTVTFRPGTEKCTVSSALYSVNSTPSLAFSTPVNGDRLEPGSSYTIFWSNLSGRNPNSVRLRLSTDGGQTYGTVLADGIVNSGYYIWNVPSTLSSAEAKLKLDGYESGYVVALAVSGEFAVGDAADTGEEDTDTGEEELVPTETVGSQVLTSYGYDPAASTQAASTISIDRQLESSSVSGGCVPNTRFKAASNPAVYYCGTDGRRYVFPNLATHNTWYGGFAGVIELTDDQVAQVTLGGNVTYRPGMRLVKIQTDPKVYAVGAGSTLRWLRTEAVAMALYGENWNQLVDDVSDALFVNYTVGDPIGDPE